MNKLLRFLRQPEFPFLLFMLCLVLFFWHIFSLADNGAGYSGFLWLFAVWAFIIFLLFLVERAENSASGREKDDV